MPELPVTPVAVVGPTASGKSDLGIALARELGGEVVNVDSMQLYRGMDIGTAKLPPAERGGIPHHLLDIWEVTRTASVAEYQARAVAEVEDIAARGAVPILVGGSMMYVQSLIDDWQFPPTDPAVRAKYEARQAEIGVQALHAELAEVDPQAAGIIEDNDPRRTVRALEVIELTGKPFQASQPPKDAPPRWAPGSSACARMPNGSTRASKNVPSSCLTEASSTKCARLSTPASPPIPPPPPRNHPTSTNGQYCATPGRCMPNGWRQQRSTSSQTQKCIARFSSGGIN